MQFVKKTAAASSAYCSPRWLAPLIAIVRTGVLAVALPAASPLPDLKVSALFVPADGDSIMVLLPVAHLGQMAAEDLPGEPRRGKQGRLASMEWRVFRSPQFSLPFCRNERRLLSPCCEFDSCAS
jgi:hypothetical protein